MLIKLAKGLIAKINSFENNGMTSEEATGRLFDSVPISAFKLKFPGYVRPDFGIEKKAGKTIGEVFGALTLENILDKSAEKILAGQFRIKVMASSEIGVNATGAPEQGEDALCLFLQQCLEAKDKRIREWADAVIKNADLPPHDSE